MGRIVVGVDGSPGARAALAWAAAEARLRQAVLEVVHAYHSQDLGTPEFFPSEHALPGMVVGVEAEPSRQDLAEEMQERAEYEGAYHNRAEQFLDTVVGELGDAVSGLDVQRTVMRDRRPAEALVDASSDADLLVVGSRGRGGFSELLLGSVSHAAVLHAFCPVVVVPSDRAGRRSG